MGIPSSGDSDVRYLRNEKLDLHSVFNSLFYFRSSIKILYRGGGYPQLPASGLSQHIDRLADFSIIPESHTEEETGCMRLDPGAVLSHAFSNSLIFHRESLLC